LGQCPPTFTPTSTLSEAEPPPLEPVSNLLPDALATPHLITEEVVIPTPPSPAGPPPDRIVIPCLGLDAPVESVGMAPSDVAGGVFEWEVPDHWAAGWLNTSAPLGLPGNTVLDGHHNVKGEVFRDLWALQAGDEITLCARAQVQRYWVS
jgi:hypothetical protein